MNEEKLEEGQKILLKDLRSLVLETEAGEFGDFTNNKYLSPKTALVEKLEALKQNVIEGRYD